MKLICISILFSAILLAGSSQAGIFASGLYGTDYSGNRVLRVDNDGTWAGVLNVRNLPQGLAFKNLDAMYVTSPANSSSVFKIDISSGGFNSSAGSA